MAQYKEKGIIIKVRDFFEADRLLTIITEKKGKLKAIAKGVRRSKAKLSGSVELFAYVDFVFVEGRNFEIVTSADIIESFKNIRSNLKKTSVVFYLAELVDKLVEENEPHQDIFDLFLQSLRKLNLQKDAEFELLINYFIINLLSYLGFRPEIKYCLNCHSKNGRDRQYFFSPKLGGVICKKCFGKDENALATSLETLKVIKLFLQYDLRITDNIKPKNIQELSQILEKFLEYVAERNFKSAKFYKHIN